MISKFREALIAIAGIIMLALFSSGLAIYILKAKSAAKQTEPIATEQSATQTETTPTEETKPARIWRGVEYGLPAGVVVGSEYIDDLPSTNFISIQQADGHIVLVKNLEWHIHSAIEEGDIIE